MDRLAKGILLFLVAVAGTVWGVGTTGFGTEAGRDVVRRLGVVLLSGALRGTAAADSVTGSVVDGLEIHNLVVKDSSGVLLARLPRVTMRYRLRDLLSFRIVLGQVIVEDPFVNLVKGPSGRFNYQEVLGLGGPSSGGGGPLVAFQDAEIHRGEVVISTPTEPPSPDDAWTPEEGEHGLMRVRYVHDLHVRASYLRIASPFPAERGLRFDLENLAARFTDPALDIRGMHGRLEIDGDSMALDVEEIRLPGTVMTINGTMRWPDGKMLLGLRIDGARVAMSDLRGLVRRLPWGMAGRGRFTLRSRGPDSLMVEGDPMELTGPRGGGRIGGRLGVLVSRTGIVRMDATDLAFDSLDLDYLRPMLDTIPFAGRLTGHVAANGPMGLLSVGLDWRFEDALVAGNPASLVAGTGLIALDTPGDLVFQNFLMNTARVDLATVRRMFPFVALRGDLGGSGRLNGQWRNIEFGGSLWHRDDTLPVTRASGLVRLDSRADTAGVWADLEVDSLDLSGVHPSYPALPRAGKLAGRVALGGYVDSMALALDLRGPVGRIVSTATLTLMPSRIRVDSLEASVFDIDVGGLYPGAVSTSLAGDVVASLALDSVTPLDASVSFRLDDPTVGGTPLDSIVGGVRIADSTVGVEASAWGDGTAGSVAGDLGLAASRTGALEVRARVDSLGLLEPLFRELVPAAVADNVLDSLSGRATFAVDVTGSTPEHEVAVDFRIPHAAAAGAWLDSLHVRAGWHSSFAEGMTVSAAIDTVSVQGYAASFVRFNVSGPRGASSWMARARLGIDGSWITWGSAYADGRVTVLALDSMRLLVPTQTWALAPGALVSVSDAGFLFRNFSLLGARPGSRLVVEGLFPTNGSATLSGNIDSLPVKDVWGLAQRSPATAAGMVSADFAVSGTAPEPVIVSSLRLDRGQFGAVQVPHMVGTLSYRDRRLVGDYEVRRNGGAPGGAAGELITDLDFDLPLDLAMEPVPERRVAGPLSIRARADSINLAFIELLTPNAENASGTFDADFGITGTWQEPRLTGRLSLANGAAAFPKIGVAHYDGNGGVHLAGDSIIIDSLSVSSGVGTVSATGYVRLERLRAPLLSLRIVGDDFSMIDVPEFMSLTTSGDVRLTGPVFGATLTGSGTLTDGIVYFADLIEKRIINLEDTLYAQLLDPEFFNREGLRPDELQRLVRGDFENRFLDSLRIDDMLLEMGSQVWLRSGEANIQMLGSVSVNKTADVYRLDGVLNTPRGTYRLPILGSREIGPVREFTVTGGEVRYFGTTDWDAALDIDAQHVVRSLRRDNVTVFVNIGGTLYDPRLTLSSDVQPAISETEIISYLLFGAPSFEALTSAGAEGRRGQLEWGSFVMAQAGGVVSGELQQYLISDLGVPIDYFQISPTQADISATVGWQPHPRVFLTVSPRLCPSSDEHFGDFGFSMEYRFSRAWLASLSNDPVQPCGLQGGRFSGTAVRYQLGLDVFWEKRY